MSDTIAFKFSPLHAVMLAFALLTGGGGAFAVFRRNSARGGEADPEAVELVGAGTVEGSVTLDVGDAAGAST